jgi:hypothetical protein
MKCEVCGKGVEAGPLYRMNEKGVKGVWRHQKCGGVPVDPIVQDISETIHEGQSQIRSESETD